MKFITRNTFVRNAIATTNVTQLYEPSYSFSASVGDYQ